MTEDQIYQQYEVIMLNDQWSIGKDYPDSELHKLREVAGA
jgi:hypothetical protein